MKKLMVALAAVAMGVAANAASISWSAASGYLYDGTGDSSSRLTSGTAYLVLSTYAQSDLVSLFANNKGDASATLSALQSNKDAYLGTGSIESSARIEGTGETSVTDSITAYFVVFNGDKMYVSNAAISTYDGLASSHELAFTTSMTASSKALPVQASAYAGGAGWIAVPEPTSGLLLLLGMAGLALKRKQA